jgi:hypothetical protein
VVSTGLETTKEKIESTNIEILNKTEYNKFE